MSTNDDLLQALAAADPLRDAPPTAPPARLLRSILAQPLVTRASRRTLSRRLLLTSAPGLAVAVAAILIGTSMLKPGSAFATWTAVPTPVDPAFAAAMQENCALRPIPTDEPNIDAERMAEMLAQQQIFAALPLVVMDQRGRAAVALFAGRLPDGQASVMCMTVAEQEGSPPVAGGGGSGTGEFETPVDGPLRLFTAQRNGSDAGTFTAYAGSVGPDVVQVTVERDEGQVVTASVTNGYFLAWWPGESYATKFVARGFAGAVLAEIGNNGWDFRDASGG
jgi:hypothetical protein